MVGGVIKYPTTTSITELKECRRQYVMFKKPDSHGNKS